MAFDERNKPEVIDEDSFQTLEDLFDSVRQNTEKFRRRLIEIQKDVADAQEREMSRAAKSWIETQDKLQKEGITDFEVYMKQLIAKRNEQDKKERLKLVNSIYEEEVKNSMKSIQKRKKEELIAQKEENQAWLKFYEDLEKSGVELTISQKEDKAQKERDVLEAKSYEAQKLAIKALNSLTNAVTSGIQEYVSYQASASARLQGVNLNRTFSEYLYGENLFGVLESRLNTAVGINPYVNNQKLMANLNDLISKGIASNVEQRAFLETIKDNIATTFDAANSSLLRIVRLQQSDSTAARLGMEAYLTRFLNSMVENTEYLTTTFDNVQSALVEASSQMSMSASTAFEYIVQKWLGALSGTGLSEETANQLAQAIGYLGSGNITALSGSPIMNLLTVSASRSGLDIGTLLNTGLTASTTNQLLRAVTDYMIELGSSGSNVVKSQLAQTFGINISDITAATALSSSLNDITKNMMSVSDMYSSLNQQMWMLPIRMSAGTMIQNQFDNMMFSLSKGIAENPALMALWQISDMVQSVTGGINIPTVGVLGNFADLETTVENLVKLGVVGVSSFNWIGDMLSGLSSALVPSSMLQKLGIIEGSEVLTRGTGLSSAISGISTSKSTFIGTSAGSDMYSQTLQSSYEAAQNTAEITPQSDETTKALPNIWEYLSKDFDESFKKLVGIVEEQAKTIKDLKGISSDILTRLNGEFEVTNQRNTESNWMF